MDGNTEIHSPSWCGLCLLIFAEWWFIMFNRLQGPQWSGTTMVNEQIGTTTIQVFQVKSKLWWLQIFQIPILQDCISNKTDFVHISWLASDHISKWPQWSDHNGHRPPRCDHNGQWPQWIQEYMQGTTMVWPQWWGTTMVRDHNGKGPQWMTTMVRDHNGQGPQW